MEKIKHSINGNVIAQFIKCKSGGFIDPDTVVNTWKDSIRPVPASDERNGFRCAQIGALYAIKAHWTVSQEPATIVMPTGTGKTETMIATVISEQVKRTLIVVPSDLLRKQTAEKFLHLGVLPKIGVIDEGVIFPVVATLTSTPKSEQDLSEIVESSNIIVTTVTLLQYFSAKFISILSEKCNLLIVDEAHHIAAKTWGRVKSQFADMTCIQFTATPFRNDGKKIDGKIIYNFPLAMAQEQGYFQKINFNPIWEFDEEKGDQAIAQAAVKQLEEDIAAGYNHAILVRAKDKKSADKLYTNIYEPLFPQFKPVLIHSDIRTTDRRERLAALTNGISKIVVCVDMFGEGIDIPNLKIAAVHDKYKSLPITLQFVGRFARTSDGLGEATFITNIANDELNESLRDLYTQDADWNKLLSIKSSEAIGKEIEDQEFAKEFSSTSVHDVAINQIRSKISMTAYKTTQRDWDTGFLYDDGFIGDKYSFTLNNEKKILVLIERVDSHADWTTFQGIYDTTWELHLAYWNSDKKILYINSTIKGFSDTLADLLFKNCQRIKGETVFRCLAGIKRLMLGTVGLKTAFDGPIRFKMFAGIDVVTGIAESTKKDSFKSNLFGVGYDGQGKISIGCSYKGRIWSRWVESINYWVSWCDEIGDKLLDNSINTHNVLSGALMPEIIKERPCMLPYGIDWNQDVESIQEERIVFSYKSKRFPFHEMEISLVDPSEQGDIRFKVYNESVEKIYKLHIGEDGFSISAIGTSVFQISIGKSTYVLSEYFNKNPPEIRLVDQTYITDGNILVKPAQQPPQFNKENIIKLDWTGTNIKKESQIFNNIKDPESIQYRMIQDLIKTDEYCIIFDDDGAGEVADIVAIKEEDQKIHFYFYHCKFSADEKPGTRVDDLYAVCGQAEKSIKWCTDPKKIIDRLIKREKTRQAAGISRIEVGSLQKLKEVKNKLRLYTSTFNIAIVQPGVDSANITEDMLQLLAGTAAYLLDTFGIVLKVYCS